MGLPTQIHFFYGVCTQHSGTFEFGSLRERFLTERETGIFLKLINHTSLQGKGSWRYDKGGEYLWDDT
jgi:hypothetical protein